MKNTTIASIPISCMAFEYQAAWKQLKVGGVLASDDIGWNTAFKDFSRRYS